MSLGRLTIPPLWPVTIVKYLGFVIAARKGVSYDLESVGNFPIATIAPLRQVNASLVGSMWRASVNSAQESRQLLSCNSSTIQTHKLAPFTSPPERCSEVSVSRQHCNLLDRKCCEISCLSPWCNLAALLYIAKGSNSFLRYRLNAGFQNLAAALSTGERDGSNTRCRKMTRAQVLELAVVRIKAVRISKFYAFSATLLVAMRL